MSGLQPRGHIASSLDEAVIKKTLDDYANNNDETTEDFNFLVVPEFISTFIPTLIFKEKNYSSYNEILLSSSKNLLYFPNAPPAFFV